MAIPSYLKGRLLLPLIGAPLFIVSNPDLVIEQCKAGIIGCFPALNARTPELLDTWVERITTELAAWQTQHLDAVIAPFAVNQIMHQSNERLERDVDVCVKHKVPIIITSLQTPTAIEKEIHGYGGHIFHDVTNIRHAKKALGEGADGLILVCAGAGGHAGTLSPFALVAEVREFFDGPVILSGAMATGAQILAAQAMGADLAYFGTRFLASQEANASNDYKQMVVESAAADITYTNLFSGVKGNYLSGSVLSAGFDPDNLPSSDKSKMDFRERDKAERQTWRDIWSAGQSSGMIHDVPSTKEIVARLQREYGAARAAIADQSAPFPNLNESGF